MQASWITAIDALSFREINEISVEPQCPASKSRGGIFRHTRNLLKLLPWGCDFFIKADGYMPVQLKVGISLLWKREIRIVMMPLSPCFIVNSISYFQGERMHVFLHGEGTCVLSIFRHGANTRKVYQRAVQCHLQSLPPAGVPKNGVDWGEAEVIEVDADWSPGLYSMTICDERGREFTGPFVVSTAERTNRFIVIANTLTWRLYNAWGGRSRYRNFLLPASILDSRIWKYLKRLIRKIFAVLSRRNISGVKLERAWSFSWLSNLRPLPNEHLRVENPMTPYLDHLAAHEWRGLAWMEVVGISYDYITDEQVGDPRFPLQDYDAVVILGHSEYWTREAIYSLERACNRQDGTSLIVLGGNCFYHEALVSKSKSIRVAKGLMRETLGTQKLTGLLQTNLSIQTFADYKLNLQELACLQAEEGFTGLNASGKQPILGSTSLLDTSLVGENYSPHTPGPSRGLMKGGGASGWEVDQLVGKSALADLRIIAEGRNKPSGAAMVLWMSETSLFFHVGSIAYVASLPVDKPLSDLTLNIFEKASQFAFERDEERMINVG